MQFTDTSADVVAAETFGRDGALFQDLLGFMTVLSVTLWAVVLLTAVVRFVACHVVYRQASYSAAPDRADRIDA
jgi:uncharacterized membrane protein